MEQALFFDTVSLSVFALVIALAGINFVIGQIYGKRVIKPEGKTAKMRRFFGYFHLATMKDFLANQRGGMAAYLVVDL